ncbi:MAG: hypothetical protein A2622_04105 [Bdellovibrionales bacterium RIFCSPHIGHO2_01_FULL_40_29]|nr:MAG: hypothetical protein A2622_04105 [Bdellovibrionales bacterium RIFCSPHIGHO2_01_FULL_40_29]OFZ34878.1 MAG: hypothetical protein A3D17_11270 [Bdellovibrionales bacterium RIFCSPHIGHO2_02_FULL_40_15]
MRQLRKNILGPLAAAIVMGFAIPAVAKSDQRPGFGEGKFIEHMTKKMDLTPEQQEKIKALPGDDSDAMKAKRESMRAAQEDLEQAMKGAASDDEVRVKFANLEKLQAEFAKARFDKILAIRAILTPEQKEKLKGMGMGMGKGDKKRRHR